ncbi:site-specific integrase [Flavobacterium sp.]|uniref:site-specific integrase n=1 Tax=Flavobacterium sp. TaxID=239 RepID=UPI0033418AA6
MLKTNFYIKADKAKLNGECPIYAKVNYNRKTITLSTGRYINPDRWKFTDNLRKPVKIQNEKVIKEYLEIFRIKIEKIYYDIQKKELDLTIEEFKAIILGKSPVNKIPHIVELIDIHNEHFSKLVAINERSKASLQKYERIKELIIQFNKKYYNCTDLPISKINGSYVFNFENFLKFESNHNGVIGIKNNTIVKYFNNLKTILNYGIKMDIVDKNPFNKYDGKISVSDATFLTVEELQRIEQKTFTIERLDKVKDIFLFSCYTGYAPVDACKLTSENVIVDADNTSWIITTRQKTGTRSNVPVLPPVLRIIEKYKSKENTLIPSISNQKMNAYLKEIADLVGITKNLTWYVARHTFATTVTLGNGVRLENVSSMLGHTVIKQTQHYAKVLDVNVMKDMKKLKDMF